MLFLIFVPPIRYGLYYTVKTSESVARSTPMMEFGQSKMDKKKPGSQEPGFCSGEFV
jgi:hypothetical protein